MVQWKRAFEWKESKNCKKELVLEAPAKINLTLDITGVLPGGYHTVETIMHPISLSDTITVGLFHKKQGIHIACDQDDIPLGKENLCYKAVERFYHYLNRETDDVFVGIQKVIPQQAGLAGGSTDAAAVLRALNILLGTGLSPIQLEEIGASFGADIPFCIRGRSVLATGFGQKLWNLPPLPPCFLVIVKPKEGSSTQAAFQKMDECGVPYHPDTRAMISALEKGSLSEIAGKLSNVFEGVLKLPEVTIAQRQLQHFGALGVLLCGSGTASFGVFDRAEVAKKAAEELQRNYAPLGWQIFCCAPEYREIEPV